MAKVKNAGGGTFDAAGRHLRSLHARRAAVGAAAEAGAPAPGGALALTPLAAVGRDAGTSIALIVPAFNEPLLGAAIQRLSALKPDELIVVHTGDPVSRNSLRDIPAPAGLQVLEAPRGRASQMNAGAAAAHADILIFVHADTLLPPTALDAVRRAVADGALWGFFAVRLSGRHPLLRVVERMMNLRSRLTGIATGDQALFVRRDAFQLVGGYARIALMEDIELCTRLKWFGRPARSTAAVITSSRRWEAHGVLRTIVRMWCLRALYALGVSPQRLVRWYG